MLARLSKPSGIGLMASLACLGVITLGLGGCTAAVRPTAPHMGNIAVYQGAWLSQDGSRQLSVEWVDADWGYWSARIERTGNTDEAAIRARCAHQDVLTYSGADISIWSCRAQPVGGIAGERAGRVGYYSAAGFERTGIPRYAQGSFAVFSVPPDGPETVIYLAPPEDGTFFSEYWELDVGGSITGYMSGYWYQMEGLTPP
ncbi:hypothetical protein [Maricaulis sp.]|uniref:hypothetical protein n=1 Tax=Maricaulis sp. TaxID=1486257 RepID=UPI003A8DC634